MNQPQLNDFEEQSSERLSRAIECGKITNSGMVHFVELICNYLNAQTLQAYADYEGISYNGAKKRKIEKFTIAGKTFVVNNE
jgi:hypothetical protein